jgi:hypothetical protein
VWPPKNDRLFAFNAQAVFLLGKSDLEIERRNNDGQ